jgi:acyl-CoA thioesterase FadM
LIATLTMARLTLEFPEDQFCYSTQLTVRVTDINAANHLGNDSMISMISEARARFLFEFGIEETQEDGTGIIVTDLATTYRAEAHARDQLLFEVGVMDFNTYGGDITFRITRSADGAWWPWPNQALCSSTTNWVRWYRCQPPSAANSARLTG